MYQITFGNLVRFISFIGVLILSALSPLWAMLQTDTHTYITCPDEGIVLAVNRETGEETKISVRGRPCSMIIYGDTGYVLNNHTHSISLIDLKTHRIRDTNLVGKHPQQIVIYKHFGYVVCGLPDAVTVLNLMSNTFVDTIIEVGKMPSRMVIHHQFGYVTNYRSGTVSVINLDSNKVSETITVGHLPGELVIAGEFGYVNNGGSEDISIIELKTNKVKRTVSLGRCPSSIVLYGNVAYIAHYDNSLFSVLDLTTFHVTNTIQLTVHPVRMIIRGHYGYVHANGGTPIIDLKTNTVIATLLNPNNLKPDFSDTHLYLGQTESILLPFILVDNPYKGIEGSFEYLDTGEEAFEQFKKAVTTENALKVKSAFKQALSVLHPKACALAAYAFLSGKWGADDQNALLWYGEFREVMDKDYFDLIVKMSLTKGEETLLKEIV